MDQMIRYLSNAHRRATTIVVIEECIGYSHKAIPEYFRANYDYVLISVHSSISGNKENENH